MLTQGYRATLVAATLAISRSSLYYRKQPRGSRAVRRTDRGGLRRKTGVRLSPGGLVAATQQRPSGESKTRIAGDARMWVDGALAAPARTTEERVGTRGSSRAESDLAVGHDEDLGGSGSGLGVPGERDRLLYAGDRGMESLASLSDRRRAGCGGAGCARTAA